MYIESLEKLILSKFAKLSAPYLKALISQFRKCHPFSWQLQVNKQKKAECERRSW